MTDSFIQLTTDGSGKKLDTVIVNLGVGSTELHREKLVIADPSSSGGYANVTSSQGLLVQATGPVSVSGTVTVVSASSGLVQISGIPVVAVSSSAIAPVNIVTSSGAYVPTTTSAGLLVQATGPTTISGTVTVLSASSGLVQISGTPTVTMSTSTLVQANIVTSSGAYVPTTTGAGLLVQATGPVSVSGTVTVLSASSGLVQISGVPAVTIQGSSGGTVVVTTSGALSVTISTASGSGSTSVNVVGTSGAVAPVTSSGGMSVTIVGGAASGSTAVNLLTSGNNFYVVTTSWGQLVTHTTETIVPVLQASSGITVIDQWMGSTAPYVGQKTMANSLPVAIASNQGTLTVAAASSGFTAIEDFLSVTSSGLACFAYVSSSSVNSNNIQSGETKFWGYSVFNTTAAQRFIKIYNTSSAPTVGTTANWLMTLGIPGSTGGGGANVMFPYPTGVSTRGLAFTMTANPPTTDTGIIGNNDLVAAFFYSV